jgi:integrase
VAIDTQRGNRVSALSKVDFYLASARSEATQRAYRTDLAAFASWGGNIPSSPQQVAEYLANSDALSPATLRRRLAALAVHHLGLGHADPTKDELVRRVFRGICRVRGRRSMGAAALDASSLMSIVSHMPRDTMGTRDRALLLVGFFCALRRQELVTLKVEDVVRGQEDWSICVRRSKTDQVGQGHLLALPALATELCPRTALMQWLAASAISDGPLFRRIAPSETISTRPLTGPAVGLILRQRAQAAGLSIVGLSAHSLRSGFAVSAARAGIAAAQIQAVTRHQTLAGLEPYVRQAGAPSESQLRRLLR